MLDRTVLVTGATDGIGKQTALELARMGAAVLVHGRNPAKGRSVVDEICRATGSEHVDLVTADLLSLRQVRGLAAEVRARCPRLDVLIHNAGVFMPQRMLTENGLEMTFAVNHLAPFFLTHLLLDLLKASGPARVVTVSSSAHSNATLDFDNLQGEKNYSGWAAYSLSKLGNVLFSFELAERLRGTGVTANCLHPGVIDTKLLRSGFPRLTGDTWAAGASTPVYLASAPELTGVTGQYFVDRCPAQPSPKAFDAVLRRKLWDVSAALAGVQ